MAAAGGKYWLALNTTTLFGEVRSLCVLCNWPGKVLWWSCEINFDEVINTRFLLPLLLSALHFFQRCNGLEISGFNRSAGEACSYAKSHLRQRSGWCSEGSSGPLQEWWDEKLRNGSHHWNRMHFWAFPHAVSSISFPSTLLSNIATSCLRSHDLLQDQIIRLLSGDRAWP